MDPPDGDAGDAGGSAELPDPTGFRAASDRWIAPGSGISVLANGELRLDLDETTESPVLRLATTRIVVDGVETVGPPDAMTLVDPTSLELRRGAAVERIRATSEGISQEWTFAAGGAGDLVVEVTGFGAEAVTTDEGGTYFTHEAALGFHYSRATWVDARGVRTAVGQELFGMTLRLMVPAAVVASSAFPAVLDPSIENEVQMDTPIAGVPSGALAQMPSVAYSGSNFLAVWRDDRNGRGSDIYGLRLSTAGVPLESSAFAITTAAGVQSHPTVAFVNGSYVVVWEDTKLPAADADLKAARVSTAGAVVQLGSVVATSGAELKPRLAARGAGALLAYEVAGSVRGSIYDGASFGGTVELVAAGTAPAVAADPSGDYLVAFTTAAAASDVRGQRVTSAGAPNGGAFDISAASGAQNEAAVGFAAGNFLVTFTSAADIYGTRVSPAGVVLDTRLEGAVTVGGVALVTAASIQQRSTIACATDCLLVWQDRRASATYFDVYSRVLSPALAPVSAEVLVAGSGTLRGQYEPAATVGGTQYLTVWRDHRDLGAGYVYAARVSAAGVPLDPGGVLLALGSNRQSRPAVSRDGARWYVVWGDSRATGDDLLGTHVNNGGSAQTVGAVSAAAHQQQQAGASYDGTNHVVAWSDGRGADFDIYAARVTSNGTTLDPSGIAVTTAAKDQFLNDVASGASRTLVVWQDRRGATGFDIYGAILDNVGAVAVPAFPIGAATGDQMAASVAFDSVTNVFLVVWQDARAGANERDIYGARVSPTGTVLDPTGVLIDAQASSQLTPAVAYGNARFFVVWDDRRNGDGGDVFGARLRNTVGGLVVDDLAGRVVTNSAGAQNTPTVAFVQTRGGTSAFVTAWIDARNQAATGIDLYGNVIDSTTGAVQSGGNGLVISANSGDETAPAISTRTPTAGGEALIAYQRFFAATSSIRIVTRLLQYSEI